MSNKYPTVQRNLALEYSSKELLELSRKDTPERYKRRLELGATRVLSAEIDYETGNAVIKLITHDHDQEIQVEDFVDLVAAEILEKYKDGVPRTALMRIVKVAVRLLLEHGDILVDCDCEDYKYRFNWLAKQYGFALKDRIQGFDYNPDISNPRQVGGICKHITKTLARESQWADQASRKLINEILAYDEFLNIVIQKDEDLTNEDPVLFDDDYEKIANNEPLNDADDDIEYTDDEVINHSNDELDNPEEEEEEEEDEYEEEEDVDNGDSNI